MSALTSSKWLGPQLKYDTFTYCSKAGLLAVARRDLLNEKTIEEHFSNLYSSVSFGGGGGGDGGGEDADTAGFNASDNDGNEGNEGDEGSYGYSAPGPDDGHGFDGNEGNEGDEGG